MDEEEISRIMACPYQNFQSLFGQVTNISFSEYIRRRKLTMAAYDLQNSDEKVMDIALKYGYQSGDAFRVAIPQNARCQPNRSETKCCSADVLLPAGVSSYSEGSGIYEVYD